MAHMGHEAEEAAGEHHEGASSPLAAHGRLSGQGYTVCLLTCAHAARHESGVLVQVSNEAKRIAEHDPLSEDMIHEHDETSGEMCSA